MMATTGCDGVFAHREHRGHWTMKFLWRSPSERRDAVRTVAGTSFESRTVVESRLYPDVKLQIARISFAGRMELMRRVRDLAQRAEFLKAGKDPADRMDAALLQGEIDQVYVTWGVKGVE